VTDAIVYSGGERKKERGRESAYVTNAFVYSKNDACASFQLLQPTSGWLAYQG